MFAQLVARQVSTRTALQNGGGGGSFAVVCITAPYGNEERLSTHASYDEACEARARLHWQANYAGATTVVKRRDGNCWIRCDAERRG